MVCLKCDCKRPGEVVANNVNSMSELGYTGNYVYKSNMDSRLVENEEKARRWFSKVSQLNNASDVSSAADDEDFPEIMPLRKGENRFVVSTRKTPLERRLVNSRYQRPSGNYDTSEGSASQNEDANKTLDLSIRKSLDQILGRSSPASGMDVQDIAAEQKAPMDLSAFPRSSPPEFQRPQENNSNYVPFVPLPADMFSKKNQNSKALSGEDAVKENYDSLSSPASHQSDSVTVGSDSQKSSDDVDFAGKPRESHTENDKKAEEQDEKSERWFQRVAELHNVKDLPSAISDEDFPEIMPTRRGENRFIISKKKDRSLTSPPYKRQVAMEQASNSKFVPFVPFPPGYFARKNTREPDGEHSESSKIVENFPEKPENVRPRIVEGTSVQETGGRISGQQSPNFSGVHSVPLSEDYGQNNFSSRNIKAETQRSGCSGEKNTSQTPNTNSVQMLENQNGQSGWSGKSLEGSAVKEPNPLDMSEEAKAERWFRRVAQIKDISELSQIPDEDFPSIMPMRKGVNRFVVSKRKTPLERRLTSQYRRNLPPVSSDPVIKENDSS